MTDKILYKFFEILFKISIFDFFISFYLKHMKYWIRKAQGRVALTTIKNAGKNCLIDGNATIHYAERLILGDNIRIGEGAFLFAKGGITIGENTQISRNVLIYSANHNIDGYAIPYDDTYIEKAVIIGNSVWIGMNVTITPGVKIGDGAIIGMGTVVSKDVPEGSIVVGSAQRIIRYRDMETFRTHEKEKKLFGLLWPDL